MRETLLRGIHKNMQTGNVYFLSSDFGAIALDDIRKDFPDNFLNVGIAEQNLINIAIGMALEGFVVYAYAIAPFFMRAYEQIRNLAITAQIRALNINLIGVGAGLSYEVSGPTHHCLEDSNIFYTLPNLEIFSPADSATVEKFVNYAQEVKQPKYLHLDGKPSADIERSDFRIEDGFSEIHQGKGICLVATGFMSRTALQSAALLREEGIDCGVIDVFLLKGLNKGKMAEALSPYQLAFTLEEAFIGNSPLAALIGDIIEEQALTLTMFKAGFKNGYIFDIGDREYLHKLNGIDKLGITRLVKKAINQW